MGYIDRRWVVHELSLEMVKKDFDCVSFNLGIASQVSEAYELRLESLLSHSRLARMLILHLVSDCSIFCNVFLLSLQSGQVCLIVNRIVLKLA